MSEATVHMWRMAVSRRESLESSSLLRKGTEDGPEEGTGELVGTAAGGLPAPAVEGLDSAAGVAGPPVGVMGDDVGGVLGGVLGRILMGG